MKMFSLRRNCCDEKQFLIPPTGVVMKDISREVSAPTPLICMRAITKTFPGVVANDGINFDVYPAEIHALLGENGAGKSTLMKILYGFYRADAGQILVNGRPVSIRSPQDARKMNIGMVFQEFTLIPALSVAENLSLIHI
ncbi:MAG: ATP-binding cassette domain-containing protein, partial [Anaerolineae bacterium]|nr:ATP-binding cassette domain-containing protein [Anaerolineae bacterium]